MITVRTQDKLYRFPDDTPQEVMKGAIDKHIQLVQNKSEYEVSPPNPENYLNQFKRGGDKVITPEKAPSPILNVPVTPEQDMNIIDEFPLRNYQIQALNKKAR